MYRSLIFVAVQVLCLQNAYCQAIDHPSYDTTEFTTTKTDIESVESVVNQASEAEPVRADPDLICPECGRPTHLCDCGCRMAATISDSYSKVANESENPQTCPHCGLSAELCTCGSLPEIATETIDVKEPEDSQKNYSRCGLPPHLCKCGSQVATTETVGDQTNNNSASVCPSCGLPVELCNCDSVSEVAVETTSAEVDQPDIPTCPVCGLPVEHCMCDVQN